MDAIRILFALAAIALTGCASTHTKNPADPLESFNRGVFRFNDTLDNAIAKPVSRGYVAVVPPPFRLMASNFFSNLDDILVTINGLLQFKIAQAASDGGRVLVNSTVGLFGIADVASSLGMEKHNEDFGQTLGYWGVGSGPYLVIPVLGPSSFRDAIGLYADSRPSQLRHVDHMRSRNQLYLTKATSNRAQLLDQEKVLDEAAIDRYQFIRDAYLQRRQNLVYDGDPPRRKYEDYEEENGFEYQEVPIPSMPSSQQNNAPAIPPPGNRPQLAAATAPPAGAGHPGVYRVWVAQRTGIR